MSRSKIKPSPMPKELKDKLLQIAVSTDLVASYKIDSWRMNAIVAARWLIRAAVELESQPAAFEKIVDSVKKLAQIANDGGGS